MSLAEERPGEESAEEFPVQTNRKQKSQRWQIIAAGVQKRGEISSAYFTCSETVIMRMVCDHKHIEDRMDSAYRHIALNKTWASGS